MKKKSIGRGSIQSMWMAINKKQKQTKRERKKEEEALASCMQWGFPIPIPLKGLCIELLYEFHSFWSGNIYICDLAS